MSLHHTKSGTPERQRYVEWINTPWAKGGGAAPVAWREDLLHKVRKRAGAVLANTPRQDQDGRTAELREMAEYAFNLAAAFLWALEGWRMEAESHSTPLPPTSEETT